MAIEDVRRQALYLARENRASDPSIGRMYWFPNENEVRLVGVSENLPSEFGESVAPFYFRPSPEDDLPYPSGIGLISPDGVERAELPIDWGTWDGAEELENDQ